jgi:hypothetical protein
MKPQTFSCLVQKLTDGLNEANTQQEMIKDLLCERMRFAISALKKKKLPISSVIEELELTLLRVTNLENNHLDKQS